jgi:two-component system, OmpR family, sensor histidine kinase KdpD
LSNGERGKLTIFLGSAAGVGKTYTMLSEANSMLKQGVDVRVGFIETHGREDTERMIGELPLIPRRKVEYRGATFEEPDVDAIIEAHPEIVLIDELAHTNVPGSKHRKRYDDIEEVLQHGIDVWSTVNIQHLESLNVLVYELTGVKVRETFPDRILEEADEIRLIDISPEALLERLRAGKVYPPGKVERSLENFFRKSNLAALRELALREVADEVVDTIQAEAAEPAPSSVAREKVLVCIGPETNAQRLVRSGWRMTKRLNAELIVVHIKREPGWVSRTRGEAAAVEERSKALRDLSLVLRAEYIEVLAENAVSAILDIVKEQRITHIIMGRPRGGRLKRYVRDPLLLQLVTRTRDVNVHVMSEEEAPVPVEGRP